MSKAQDLMDRASARLAEELGVPELFAVYFRLASEGRLRTLHPDSAQFLQRTRRRFGNDRLSAAEIAALDEHLPGWRTETPATMDAAWRERTNQLQLGAVAERFLDAARRGELRSTKGGPVWLSQQRTKAKTGRLEQWRIDAYEAAMPGWVTSTPRQLDLRAIERRRREGRDWTLLVEAATAGRFRDHEQLLADARASFAADDPEGIPDHVAYALDENAPSWREISADALDEGFHAMAGTTPPGWDRNHLDDARNGRLGDYASALEWLTDLRDREHRTDLSPLLLEQLDATIPGWLHLEPRAIFHLNRGQHGRMATNPDADRFLTDLRRQSAHGMSEDFRLHLDAFILGWDYSDAEHIDQAWYLRRNLTPPSWTHDWLNLARTGRLIDHRAHAEAWLTQLQDDDAVGLLVPSARQAIDAAFPVWQSATIEDLDAEAIASSEPFSARGMYYLALAAAGRLSTVGHTATWLKRLRWEPRLSAAKARLLNAVIPTWRTEGPAALDAARRATGLAESGAAEVDIRSLAMLSASGSLFEYDATLRRLRAGAAANELLPSQLRLLDRLIPGWREEEAFLDALTEGIIDAARTGDFRRAVSVKPWLARQRRLLHDGLLDPATIRRFDRTLTDWRDDAPSETARPAAPISLAERRTRRVDASTPRLAA